MKLPEHLALSYLVAQCGAQQEFGNVGTALIVAAGLLPDLDGLTILGGWHCHRRYHRVIGHGLPVTLAGPLALAGVGAALLGTAAFGPLWLWLQLSLLVHLATDCCFYRWPVQLLWPLSSRGLGFGWIAWNDLVPTALLYAGVVLAVAWPGAAPSAAAATLAALAVYLAWRAVRPSPWGRWHAWLAGGWARSAPRFCRWLTGDFIP